MTHASLQHERQESTRSLWLSLLSGPIIYTLYFLLVYFLVETACQANLLRVDILGMNRISFWVLVSTVIAMSITMGSAGLAWRQWRRVRGEQPTRLEHSSPLLIVSGIWLNLFFTIVIGLTGLPTLILVTCDWI